MAPHFASEMWSRFLLAPNRKNQSPQEINWDEDILKQQWPEVDAEFPLTISVRINCVDIAVFKYPRQQFDQLKHGEVLKEALADEEVINTMGSLNITSTRFEHYPGCQAFFHIFLDQPIKVKKDKQKEKKQKRKAAN